MMLVKKSMKVYISGLSSDSNPSPGIGIARSLRLAYPKATLVGVDYSNRSLGLHWPEFDDIWLQPSWDEINLEQYSMQVKNILEQSLWISGLDLEILWLSQTLGSHSNLLIPPLTALQVTRKPDFALGDLPFRIPPFIHLSSHDWKLLEFCRKNGWRIWLKGPHYEARRIRNWPELKYWRRELAKTWSTFDDLYLQVHIRGYEECISFCAYRGELLDYVYMRKMVLTPEGKTWAGRIINLPKTILDWLKGVIKKINWTGGAELELIRDSENNLWLIEWNPRFPAWIYGATIAGRNLPACLVNKATGIQAKKSTLQSSEFVRVVLEIPTRATFPLPSLTESSITDFGFQFKHPSGMPLLARQLRRLEGYHSTDAIKIPSSILNDLRKFDLDNQETPSWLFLETTAQTTFQRIRNLIDAIRPSDLQIYVAYSIKTNPDNRFLKLARQQNFLVEAISQLEVQKALLNGFTSNQIILNGPGKWWPRGSISCPFAAIFCDSLQEMEHLLGDIETTIQLSKIVGVRLRPPRYQSRFGVEIDNYKKFHQLISLIQKLPSQHPFGIHFHIASSVIGTSNWWRLYDSILQWGRSIQSVSGKSISCLDIGGGWFPDDWISELEPKLESAIFRALKYLPKLQFFILEPGKALTQHSEALATRILEVRKFNGQVEEIVVDASIAELPQILYVPHRILIRNGRDWDIIQRGSARIVGRLCMEEDILIEDVYIPTHVRAGDILIFLDCGAYDRSMSYDFGKG